jgi:ribonuclease HI
MPFGVSSAPRIFSKIMGHAINVIRERWKLTAVQYLDDLLFLHSVHHWLKAQTVKIITFLEELGWTINRAKSRLEPQQQFVFLGMEWSSTSMTVKVEKEKNRQLIKMIKKFKKWTLMGKRIQVRMLARVIGRLSQTRMQHQRASVYLSKLNLMKTIAVKQAGWNGSVRLTPQVISEVGWWQHHLQRNEATNIRSPQPSSTLYTDASPQGWGGWLTVQGERDGEWMVHGCWKEQTPQTSNFREMTAVFLAMQHFFKLHAIQPKTTVLLRSDNSTTIFDINRMRANRTLILPLKHILNFSWKREIHITAMHIPGIQNTVTDKLSRLERSGDYAIAQEVLEMGLKQLGAKIDIDLFANQKNKKCQRYVTISKRAGATERDAFSMVWKTFWPLIHPPIPLILKCLRKLKEERGKGVVVLPAWKGQVWTSLLHDMTVREVNLGESSKILTPGRLMIRCGTELPPGTLKACLVDASIRTDGSIGMRSLPQ